MAIRKKAAVKDPDYITGDPIHDPKYVEPEPDFEKYPMLPPTNPDDEYM